MKRANKLLFLRNHLRRGIDSGRSDIQLRLINVMHLEALLQRDSFLGRNVNLAVDDRIHYSPISRVVSNLEHGLKYGWLGVD